MARIDPRRLLDEARLLAAYASRQGRLPVKDNVGATIIDADEKLRKKKFTTEDERNVNVVINQLARRIAPATVDEVRSFYGAPAAQGEIKSLVRRFIRRPAVSTVVSIICFFLIIVIINLTTTFNQLDIIIADMKAVEDGNYFAQLDRARAFFKDSIALIADPVKKEGPSEALQKLVVDMQNNIKAVRDLDGKLSSSASSIVLMLDASTGAPYWCRLLFNTYGFANVLCSTTPSVVDEGDLPPNRNNESFVSKDDGSSPPVDAGKKPSSTDYVELVKLLMLEELRVADSLGLTVTSFAQLQAVYRLRRHAEALGIFLGGSILPLLYGFLGAAVFLMRRFFELQQWTQDNAAAKVFLRLGLGGISGLAIGWFWTPSTSGEALDMVNLSTTPFALAFLAGFSIDLLFSLLDRFVDAMTPNGKYEAKAPEGRASEENVAGGKAN